MTAPSGDFYDNLFGDNGKNVAPPEPAKLPTSGIAGMVAKDTPQPRATMQTFQSYLPDGSAYRPYDRLVRLNQGERTGGITDQMLMEAAKLKSAGYTDVYRQFNLTRDYEKAMQFGTAAIVGLGKLMSPLLAPQQVAFTGLKTVTDLAQGKNPGEDLKRGMGAATSLVTWGLLNGGHSEDAIWGKELTTQWGLTGRTAGVVGGLMDFFADPLLFAGVLGVAGKAAEAGKFGNVLRPTGGALEGLTEAERIYGAAPGRGSRVGDAFQSLASMTDVVYSFANRTQKELVEPSGFLVL